MDTQKIGRRVHLALTEDKSATLSSTETKSIQSIVGSFLYYTRAVDNTVHTALNYIAFSQASPHRKQKMLQL